jgi:hypothetical protein
MLVILIRKVFLIQNLSDSSIEPVITEGKRNVICTKFTPRRLGGVLKHFPGGQKGIRPNLGITPRYRTTSITRRPGCVPSWARHG